jgi:hypothetical protein
MINTISWNGAVAFFRIYAYTILKSNSYDISFVWILFTLMQTVNTSHIVIRSDSFMNGRVNSLLLPHRYLKIKSVNRLGQRRKNQETLNYIM